MKKGKRKYIIIIIVLIVYCIGMYYAFGVKETKERNATTTILVGNSAIWNYSSRQWMNLTSQNMLSSLNWQEFTIYINNEYFGNYLVWRDDKWYLFNKDRQAISYQGDLFAYKAGFDMQILSFSKKEITDYTYVNKVLSEYQINENTQYTLANMASFDFDQDGLDEDFYMVSNVFADDFFPDKYFSFVFMVKNEEIYMLYEDIDTNNGVNGCKPSISAVADVDNDDDYELIVECVKYSAQIPVTMLYEFEENAFKITISNQ